ncbi:MAG: chorismate lyase [Steroidobacteraceae bacterium]
MNDIGANRWIDAAQLAEHCEDARLRSWLLTPGLMTERIRAACGERFRFRLRSQTVAAEGLEREIEFRHGHELWLLARTRVPRVMLDAEPWLLELDAKPLGGTLAAHAGVRRAPPDFSLASPDDPLARHALAIAALAPQCLWQRRTRFVINDHAMILIEVFLPAIGREEPL